VTKWVNPLQQEEGVMISGTYYVSHIEEQAAVVNGDEWEKVGWLSAHRDYRGFIYSPVLCAWTALPSRAREQS
jgi:hypothetical protein